MLRAGTRVGGCRRTRRNGRPMSGRASLGPAACCYASLAGRPLRAPHAPRSTLNSRNRRAGNGASNFQTMLMRMALAAASWRSSARPLRETLERSSCTSAGILPASAVRRGGRERSSVSRHQAGRMPAANSFATSLSRLRPSAFVLRHACRASVRNCSSEAVRPCG